MWIAIFVYLCPDLLHYMDDAWSYEMDPILVYYEPYDCCFPHKQVKLLLLYDELGLPHIKQKQVFGKSLKIIGMVVDPTNMTISMSLNARNDLTAAIRAFVDTSQSRRHPVIEWQWILGWINWALNAYPLVFPALQLAYAKIASKVISCTQLYLNCVVILHFLWLADTIEASDGIHILDAKEWDSNDADLAIYSDASLSGLGFVIPKILLGFCASTPTDCATPTIFYYEALAIASAILWTSGQTSNIRRLLVYTNSLNCIKINTLSV